ncbi:MAG TPA: YigZ family protein [Trueperaceae bacterium]|nr:YigZ family protein [Trueperaceae bacterium]
MPYLTPAGPASFEAVIDNSRFIAEVAPVASVEAALELLARAKAQHPAASHHCLAYKVGDEMRFSDDGEPAGSAGRPILEVILKRGLDRCAAVVVRYFGGKKLGVGGLLRAYGGTAAKAFDAAGSHEVLDRERLEIRAPFAAVDAVLRALGSAASDVATRFDERGLVAVVDVLTSERDALEEHLAELTRGAASVQTLSDFT